MRTETIQVTAGNNANENEIENASFLRPASSISQI